MPSFSILVSRHLISSISTQTTTVGCRSPHTHTHTHTHNIHSHWQVGGADQWGNITTGCEFVRKRTGDIVHGESIPSQGNLDSAH